MNELGDLKAEIGAMAAAVVIACMGAAVGWAAEEKTVPQCPADRCGVPGGLCVQVGGGDMTLAVELARTGRFLVQVLEPDAARVDRLREELLGQGLYGLVSVDRLDSPASLPYAENLVNLVVLESPGPDVPLAELLRVLCPRGVILTAAAEREAAFRAAGLEVASLAQGGRQWTTARKPWPAEMDEWRHARHGADGNAVSADRVAGPPRRVRWVAGPWREISNMVSCDGRNYYGGVWARDGFNGLRLWKRALEPSPARGGFGFGAAPGSVRPVAGPGRLFVVSEGKLVALDGATGEPVLEYTAAGTPTEILYTDGALVTIDKQSIRTLEADTGKLRWQFAASEPQYTVAGDGAVYFLNGAPRHGEKLAAVSLDLATGSVRWQKDDYPFLPKVRRMVYHASRLAFEVSTLADEKLGNALHVVSAADGQPQWSRDYVPSMNHMKQARPMFVGDLVWLAEDRHCVSLDPVTGEVRQNYQAGLCHCFPPVATARYMLCGEIEMTDLADGTFDSNHITKAACGRDAGWVPANGLVNVTPKHCVCWPMLRGYVAMAPARPGGELPKSLEEIRFSLEKGVEPPQGVPTAADDQWPCYRQNAWRSGSTPAAVPAQLKTLWNADLGPWPEGTIADDWRENPFVPGPVSAPVVSGGLVYVARPDAHQVVALDAQNGQERWRFTANGRVDRPPTIHRGLCLFGTKSGWVYCLRADDGRLVWRLRAAPIEERIVAYGQIESPWPVPGSVLVVDDVAYFAAGRHPLAEGGVLVFAVEPADGRIRWVKRLDTLPTTNFYGSSALEYPCFDLMHQEGDAVTMSRWLFDRATGQMTVKADEAFALLRTGGAGVMVPRSYWSYAPRHQPRLPRGERPVQPLLVFRNDTLWGCLNDWQTVYRRDFDRAGLEQFDRRWVTGWAQEERFRKMPDEAWQSQRLAKNATWTARAFPETDASQKVAGMVLAGDVLFVAGSQGGLRALSAQEGKVLAEIDVPAPVWDGLAAAAGRLFVSTAEGRVVCLGP